MDIMDELREYVDSLVESAFSRESDDEGCAFCGCMLGDDELAYEVCQPCRESNGI